MVLCSEFFEISLCAIMMTIYPNLKIKIQNFFLSLRNSSARSALNGCSGSGSFTKAIKACITNIKIEILKLFNVKLFMFGLFNLYIKYKLGSFFLVIAAILKIESSEGSKIRQVHQ
ncbi:Cullin-3 [Vespula squamosa]|uniref:Cullin-3 n=1 Tax=Vespula squamosa TaxID=30214 RepID=A0ABD2A4X6_VESSQ